MMVGPYCSGLEVKLCPALALFLQILPLSLPPLPASLLPPSCPQPVISLHQIALFLSDLNQASVASPNDTGLGLTQRKS